MFDAGLTLRCWKLVFSFWSSLPAMLRDLGVYVDGDLSLEAHISSLPHVLLSLSSATCRAPESHHGLRSLAYQSTCSQSGRSPATVGSESYLPQTQINGLQSILRAAACLVLQLPGWASVSNLMRVQLHWLSIPQRIQFKLCSVVYRCLHDMAPIYLIRDLCVPISSLEGRSHIRSAAAGDLRIPSAKTVTISRRGFSVAGPAAWNNLSTTLKDYTLTFTAFKKLLKTEL